MSRESRGERANRRVQMRRGPDERAGRARKRARARPRASPALRPGDGLCMETSAEEEKKSNARPRTHRSWAACSPSSAAAPRADARVGPPYSFELFLRRSWTRRACVTAPGCRHCYPGFGRRCLKLPVTLYLSPQSPGQITSAFNHTRAPSEEIFSDAFLLFVFRPPSIRICLLTTIPSIELERDFGQTNQTHHELLIDP